MAAAAAAAAAAGEAGEGAGGEVCVDAPHHTDVRCTPEIDLFQLQHHHLLTCLEHTTVSLSSIRIRLVKWLRGINTSKNYGASPAIDIAFCYSAFIFSALFGLRFMSVPNP